MRSRAPVALLAGAVLWALPGCGAGEPSPPGADDSSGRFVGRDDRGLGVSVDFAGYDGVSRDLEEALEDGGTVDAAVVALVNTSSRVVPIPTFSAVRADGTSVALDSAERALGSRTDAAARRVRERLSTLDFVPPEATLTVYVVLRGGWQDLVDVRMRSGPRAPVSLRDDR